MDGYLSFCYNLVIHSANISANPPAVLDYPRQTALPSWSPFRPLHGLHSRSWSASRETTCFTGRNGKLGRWVSGFILMASWEIPSFLWGFNSKIMNIKLNLLGIFGLAGKTHPMVFANNPFNSSNDCWNGYGVTFHRGPLGLLGWVKYGQILQFLGIHHIHQMWIKMEDH